MNLGDFPAPKEGFVITHVLVVADQDRSREFYRSLLGGQVLLEGDPVIIRVANTWLTLVTGGGPTGDKPRRRDCQNQPALSLPNVSNVRSA